VWSRTFGRIIPLRRVPPDSANSGAATSPLDYQISDAEEKIEKQKETIIQLVAEGADAAIARKQLDALVEDLVFLVKLRSIST
jgi:hypothetical protein